MRGSALSNAVRVLLIVSGLVTIGLGCYAIKLEWSLLHAERILVRELPSDLNTLTREELLSLRTSIKNQMDAEQAAYKHDKEVYKKKSAVSLILIVSGSVMLLLSMIHFYLLRTQRPVRP